MIGFQRAYPNTLCSEIDKSKGLQWVDTDATLVIPTNTNGVKRVVSHLVIENE